MAAKNKIIVRGETLPSSMASSKTLALLAVAASSSAFSSRF